MEDRILIKHTGAIHMANSLTLTQRKVVNILLKNAFSELNQDKTHTLPLSTLMDFLGWSSTSEVTKLLKDSLKNLNIQQLEWNIFQKDRQKVWGVTTLLAYVQISHGQVEYAYSKPLRDLLYNPNIYARLNLAIQRVFTNKHALVLWEYLCECLCSNKVEKITTDPILMDEFKKLLGIQTHKSYASFSALNAQVIKPALLEINEKSDLNVMVKFKKQGKKVTAVSFTSSRKDTHAICSHPEKVFEFLIHEAKEMGISEQLIKQNLKIYSAEKIKKALEIVADDIKAHKTIHSRQAYYVACLKNGWEKSTALIPAPVQQPLTVDLSKIQQDFYAEERQALLKKIGTKTYASWFQEVVFEESSSQELLVKTSSSFCADHIHSKFLDVICQTWQELGRNICKVRVV
jgi:plasmid replication initiation protein